ncbi:MAG TPA: PilZ domain-containing protein [Thermodesulfovibrionales bacterium]|nr:PilZ domain-containing protein [Thermodesulfovibrionales bacterium]
MKDDEEKTERRNCRRFPFREEILLDGIHCCTSYDISEAGIYVSGARYFDEDDVVEITLPIGEEKITVKGQVKNCQPGIGAGLVFIDLHNDQRARIRGFIESIAKSYEKQMGA